MQMQSGHTQKYNGYKCTIKIQTKPPIHNREEEICHIDLIHGTIFDYVIHFRMAKAQERPYTTVCKAVSEEA